MHTLLAIDLISLAADLVTLWFAVSVNAVRAAHAAQKVKPIKAR